MRMQLLPTGITLGLVGLLGVIPPATAGRVRCEVRCGYRIARRVP